MKQLYSIKNNRRICSAGAFCPNALGIAFSKAFNSSFFFLSSISTQSSSSFSVFMVYHYLLLKLHSVFLLIFSHTKHLLYFIITTIRCLTFYVYSYILTPIFSTSALYTKNSFLFVSVDTDLLDNIRYTVIGLGKETCLGRR